MNDGLYKVFSKKLLQKNIFSIRKVCQNSFLAKLSTYYVTGIL
jgi:hypothetical protein